MRILAGVVIGFGLIVGALWMKVSWDACSMVRLNREIRALGVPSNIPPVDSCPNFIYDLQTKFEQAH